MTYRQSRAFEASIIDYLIQELSQDWSDVTVEKAWSKVKDITLPIVLVRCGTSLHNRVEIGDSTTWRESQILIDIFGKSDGMREDLKDFIIEKIKGGCPYYTYVIENGKIKSKTASGRINVSKIGDEPVNSDMDKNNLSPSDRYRHLITLTVSTGKVE